MRDAGSQQPVMKNLIALTVACAVVFVVSPAFAEEGVDELPRWPSSGDRQPKSLTDPTTWLVGIAIILIPAIPVIAWRFGWQVRATFFILLVFSIALLGAMPALILLSIARWLDWDLPDRPVLVTSMVACVVVYVVYLARQKNLEN